MDQKTNTKTAVFQTPESVGRIEREGAWVRMDNLVTHFDEITKRRAEAVEEIRYYKLSKLVELHSDEIPSVIVSLIKNLVALKDAASAQELARYCEEFGYFFEFVQPAPDYRNFKSGVLENGNYELRMNIKVEDYKLILKKIVAKV